MARPLWVVDLLKRNFKFRFLGAELTKVPLLGTAMEKWLFNGYKTGDALFYLPQDHVFINAQIEEPENVIVPSDVVRFFINQSNYHFIMNECICRSANHCQDFPHDYGCLFLGEGVLDINPGLGRLVNREEALAHEAKCQELGLVHLIGRDKIDAVWMGVPSSTKLMTICNCCPCCCLFKFLPNLAPKLRAKLTRMPGIHLEVTSDCIGCGACTEEVCFIDVIHVVKGRAVIDEECRGCGKCITACPENAIQLIIDDDDFILNAISRLKSAVDVR